MVIGDDPEVVNDFAALNPKITLRFLYHCSSTALNENL